MVTLDSLEDIIYHPISTKTEPNKIMKEEILPFFKKHGVKRVLDYGCGRYLRDSFLLSKHRIHVDAVDLEEQIENIKKKGKNITISSEIEDRVYDAVLLNFVLQVLPTKEQRDEVLRKTYDVLRAGGYFVLSLRQDAGDIQRSGVTKNLPFNDGFLTKRNDKYTFVRGYTREEVKDILQDMNLELLKFYRTGMSYITLSKKSPSDLLTYGPSCA